MAASSMDEQVPSSSSADVAVSAPSYCRLCGESRWADQFVPRLGAASLGITVYRCAHCGSGTTHRDNPIGVEELYDDSYYAYSEATYPGWRKTAKALLYRLARFQSVRLLLKRGITLLPPCESGRVLDAGCSVGAFLDVMRQLGWETYGTEISQKAAAVARRKRHAVCSPHEISQLPALHFDWVTLNNVLEHIEGPHEALKDLRRLLKTEGVLSIVVPNFDCEDAHLFREFWQCLEVPQHYYHYTEKGLRNVLGDSGFEILEINHVPRYALGQSLRNTRSDLPREARIRLVRRLRWLQVRRTARLLAPGKIDSRYGLFLTAHAKKAR